MAVDKQDLDTLQDEVTSQIIAHIDARHEELLQSLRADILNGIYKMLHRQNDIHIQQAANPEGVFDFWRGRDDVEIIPDALPPLCSLGSFCSAETDTRNFEPITIYPQSRQERVEAFDPKGFEQPIQPSFRAKTTVAVNKGTRGSILPPREVDKPSPSSSPTKGDPSQSSSPTKGEQSQASESSPPSKKNEFRNRQLGLAKGEFEGRSNLWALLQAKDWDSLQAQEPDNPVDDHAKDGRKTIRNRLKTIVHSTGFDVFIGSLILINSVVMGLQLEFQGIGSADAIGIQGDDSESSWPNAEEAFGALEHVFALLYLVELILRLQVDRCAFFKHMLNWLDFVIVVVACLELYIIPLTGQASPDLRLIKLMRALRIARVLRMVRLLKLLPRLRTLVKAVVGSIGSLLWSIVLMSLYILIAAVFITQSLQDYLRDESEDPIQRGQVYECYGSFSRSLITMFEITLAAGTWGACGKIVVFESSRLYAIFYLGYLGLVSFALIRVIAALFLKDTLASSAKDADLAMADQFKDPHYVKEVWQVFKLLDKNSNGAVHFTELRQVLQDAHVAKEVAKLGVAPHEMVGLFTLMDDGDDEVSFCEFLSGIMRLKNASKGVELSTLLYENKKLLKRVLAIGNQVDALKEVLQSR